MQAERVLLKTDEKGNLMGVPKLPPNARLEAIFLLLEKEEASKTKRIPPESLKGSVRITGDLLEPAISEEEWEASFERTARQLAGDPEAFK